MEVLSELLVGRLLHESVLNSWVGFWGAGWEVAFRHGRAEWRRERERNLYFPVVTGTHYRTKTPPDQQPMRLSQGYDETRLYAIYSVF